MYTGWTSRMEFPGFERINLNEDADPAPSGKKEESGVRVHREVGRVHEGRLREEEDRHHIRASESEFVGDVSLMAVVVVSQIIPD